MVLSSQGLFPFVPFLGCNVRFRFSEDSALCFILSGFMGVGLLLASILQRTAPLQYKQMLAFLYGQPSLLGWSHCVFYAIFCVILVIWLITSFRSIKAYLFDKEFAMASGLASSITEGVFSFFSTLAIILGFEKCRSYFTRGCAGFCCGYGEAACKEVIHVVYCGGFSGDYFCLCRLIFFFLVSYWL